MLACKRHSGLIPAVSITLAHFSMSLTTRAAACAGVNTAEYGHFGEPRLDARICEAGVDLAVEPLDDVDRRAARRADAVQPLRSKPGSCPVHCRHVGQRRARALDIIASARIEPLRTCGSEFGSASTPAWMRPGMRSPIITTPPAIGYVNHVDAGLHLINSIDRWLMVFTPNEAMLIFPGSLWRRSRTRRRSSPAGRDGPPGPAAIRQVRTPARCRA